MTKHKYSGPTSVAFSEVWRAIRIVQSRGPYFSSLVTVSSSYLGTLGFARRRRERKRQFIAPGSKTQLSPQFPPEGFSSQPPTVGTENAEHSQPRLPCIKRDRDCGLAKADSYPYLNCELLKRRRDPAEALLARSRQQQQLRSVPEGAGLGAASEGRQCKLRSVNSGGGGMAAAAGSPRGPF